VFRYIFKRNSQKKIKENLLNKKLQHKELDSYKELEGLTIESNLNSNIQFIEQLLGKSSDLVIHKFISAYKNTPVVIVYIDGLVEKAEVNEQILGSLMKDFRKYETFDQQLTKVEDVFKYQLITITGINELSNWEEIILKIISGDTALFIDGTNTALLASTRAWESRGIQEPVNETSVRGPHEGFSETLRTNTALIRRKIRDPFLRLDLMYIGLRSQTEVVVSYIEGLTDPNIVAEAKRRLKNIDIDRVLSGAEIEQFIEDNSLTIFPQISDTERPDVVVSGLLDGQVALIVDNSPYVILLPFTLTLFLRSSDDYYERWYYGSIIRLLRYIAVFLVMAAPGLYISLISINPELLPTNLLISTAAALSGVPFPIIIELLLMEITLELLREAGVRLPKPIGQTISIVGALVLGEAAITAGIVSPLTVIVVAITAIASFAIPSYTFGTAVRLSRFPVTIISAIFGLFGWLLSLIFISIHLINLKSYNIPYLAPINPFIAADMDDSIVIAPTKIRKKRPIFLHGEQIVRSNNTIPKVFKHKRGKEKDE